MEKSETAKTYDSPKSKKSKNTKQSKTLEKKIKEEKVSPKPKKTPKKEIRTSPFGKVAVKTDETKKNEDIEIKSGDKIESNVKSEKDDKQVIVAGK